MDERRERDNLRRGWHGNLNFIPLQIAYDFELQLIIDNDPADGFRCSPRRIAAARDELGTRHAARCQ